MLAIHRWEPGAATPVAMPTHSPAQALSEAWTGGRRDLVVVAEAWEEARKPTRWEAAHGRVFCAPGARALHHRLFQARSLPETLDSAYGILERRRPASRDPYRWVIEEASAPRPARIRVPDASDAERPVYEALLAAGGPVRDRDVDLGPGFSARREKVVLGGNATLYIGYGTWLLLGRDVPLGADAAARLAGTARRLLDKGPMEFTELLADLRRVAPEAAGLDGTVVLAALLRRCGDVLVDDRSGYAAALRPGSPLLRHNALSRPALLPAFPTAASLASTHP